MKKQLFFLALCLVLVAKSYATHLRAGEITYQTIGPFSIKATITTYTEVGNNNYDDDSLRISWGDGTPTEVLYRTNGPIGGSGFPSGVIVRNGIKKNTYEGTHTFAGAPPAPNNFYLINTTIENRNAQILNIKGGNSVNTAFYVEDTVWFPGSISNWGYNSSPILLNPPVDFANVGDTFYHNPLAFDPDGDSLIFEKITPREAQNNFIFPYVYPDVYAGGANTYTVNRFTGEIIWAVPQQQGNYNIAVIIREYRRGVLMGTMIRDMQIIVQNSFNDPPQIDDLLDTCVRAGDLLKIDFFATDPQFTQTVTLSANGGPFFLASSLSPATFTANSGNPADGHFRWQTICNHIQRQFYQVIITAEDNYTTPLTDIETWQIEVIAPPPINLVATPVGNTAVLNWNGYNCASFNEFRGFSVWKRNGSNPFVPAYCETGLAGRGYTMIADGIFDTTYIDADLKRGQQTCYRILAHFSKKSPNQIFEYDKVESVPSNETCILLPLDIPVITKVSVAATSTTAGIMDLEWTKPRAGALLLDTLLTPPPYTFRLYRSQGIVNTANTLIHSVTKNSYYDFNDTTYTDTNLNTTDNPYTYKVVLLAGADSLGETNTASSVYLSLVPRDQRINLSWAYQVPWRQDSFQIFRKDFVNTSYTYIATTTQNNYADTALFNDSTYCYLIKAFGGYDVANIYRPLINFSEEKCAAPTDLQPPCAPTLAVNNNCGQPNLAYENILSWINNSNDSCEKDIIGYQIYYTESDTNAFTNIATINDKDSTTFVHNLHLSLAGCYAVTTFDRNRNESVKSNIICVDNCPIYNLPNTFTPNGDGQNDLFTPFIPYYFVEKIEMKIFNRWGEKVFETTNPDILWDGKDYKTKKDLPDGVYFYAGYYWERRLAGEVKHKLPGKNGSGEIHLIRGK